MATTYAQPLFGLGTVPKKQLDLSGVAQMPVNAGMTGQAAILDRLNPLLAQQRSQSETQWTNQGLRPGGEAYDNAANLLGQQENDARTQAILQGLNLDMSANNQGFGQALDSGNFENNAAGQGFNQNLAGQQFGYQQQQDANNINAAQDNSRMQGLFSLGSSVGVPLLSKAISGGFGKPPVPPIGGQPPVGGVPPAGGGGGGGSTLSSIGSLGLKNGLFGLGSATLPIIGGALTAGALIWKATQKHQTADKWVQGNQNNFDQTWSQIEQAQQSGQIPPEQAQQIKQQNAQQYLTELQKFMQKGGKERTVGQQALATFRQYYGDPRQYGVAI